jgi:hypothetical protein
MYSAQDMEHEVQAIDDPLRIYRQASPRYSAMYQVWLANDHVVEFIDTVNEPSISASGTRDVGRAYGKAEAASRL